jgi:cytidylate kinase-like protein
MSKHTTDELSVVGPIADRQVRQWELGLRAANRPAPTLAVARLPEDVHPYVTISREAGADGGRVGALVAERLGCQCLDERLLTYVAERYGLPEGFLRLVDERVSGWLYETVRLWLAGGSVTQDEYMMRVGQLVLTAACHATTVFVGRGVQFLLPRSRGFAVRIVAPLEQRIAGAMVRRGLGRDAAAAWVSETDAGRTFLIRRYFHEDVGDPHLYDAVLNLEHMDAATAADIIAEAHRRRFAGSA